MSFYLSVICLNEGFMLNSMNLIKIILHLLDFLPYLKFCVNTLKFPFYNLQIFFKQNLKFSLHINESHSTN